jgi:exodeoxyribonuclease VIII
MKRISLDLETLSDKPNAAIGAIGACYFDPETGLIGDTFYRVVDLRGQPERGLDIDPDTVCWWMEQSHEARAIFNAESAIQLSFALMDFARFVSPNEETALVYGNGKDFDNVILSTAYRALGMKRPWGRRNDACYRDLKRAHRDIEKPVRRGVQHNALDDAVFQAKHMIDILRAYPETTKGE